MAQYVCIHMNDYIVFACMSKYPYMVTKILVSKYEYLLRTKFLFAEILNLIFQFSRFTILHNISTSSNLQILRLVTRMQE